MKVAQNNETNPDTQPVRPPHIPSIANTQLSPPVHLSENAEHRGYFPGCFPPSLVSPPTALGHPWHRVSPCYALCCFDCSVIYYVPPPLLLSSRPRDCRRPPIDYGVDEPSFSAELPGKAPLDHQISPILLYTACIRVV